MTDVSGGMEVEEEREPNGWSAHEFSILGAVAEDAVKAVIRRLAHKLTR